MCIYLQWYRPFASNFVNNIETFNECTILVLTYFLFCFSDFVPDPETRSNLGFYYISTSFFNMLVNMFIMMKDSFTRGR